MPPAPARQNSRYSLRVPKRLTLNDLALVFAGGFLGTLLRFIINQTMPQTSDFPLATFTVNMVGSLALGVLMGFIAGTGRKSVSKNSASPQLSSAQSSSTLRLRLFFGVGLLGAFTTYSAFALEAAFFSAAALPTTVFYAIASIVLGIALALVGLKLGQGLGRAAK